MAPSRAEVIIFGAVGLLLSSSRGPLLIVVGAGVVDSLPDAHVGKPIPRHPRRKELACWNRCRRTGPDTTRGTACSPGNSTGPVL
jgi:hypothetical protein